MSFFTFSLKFLPSHWSDYSSLSNSLNKLGEERALAIFQIARSFADQWNLDSLAVLPRHRAPLVPHFAEAIYNSDNDIRVYFNYFFLLEPRDFSPDLKLTSDDDLRLYDDNYLNKVVEVIKTTLGT
jgi:hypothetical protein